MSGIAHRYIVRAQWDGEAKVWVATSEDIPGLVCESANLEELISEVTELAPELLAANGVVAGDGGSLPIHVMADRLELVGTVRK